MPAMIIKFVQKGETLEAQMQNPMGEEMKGTIAMGDMGESLVRQEGGIIPLSEIFLAAIG